MDNDKRVVVRQTCLSSDDDSESESEMPQPLHVSDYESAYKRVRPQTRNMLYDDQEYISDDEESDISLTVLLVGKSKSGMSTIAKLFNKYKKFKSENTHLSFGLSTGFINNRRTTLVDIPGLFREYDDTNEAERMLQSYLSRSFQTEIIVLVVIRAASLTQYDIKVIDLIRNLNSIFRIKHTILIFTCKESDAKHFTAAKFIEESKELSDIVSLYDCKHCLFTSSQKKESENVHALFSIVVDLIAKTACDREKKYISNESQDSMVPVKVNEKVKPTHKNKMYNPSRRLITGLTCRKRSVENYDSRFYINNAQIESEYHRESALDTLSKKEKIRCLPCTIV